MIASVILNRDHITQENKVQNRPNLTTKMEQMATIPLKISQHIKTQIQMIYNKIMDKDRAMRMEHKLQRMDRLAKGNLK